MIRRISSALVLAAVFGSVFVVFSRLPFPMSKDEQAGMILVLYSIPKASDICRKVSDEEKAKMLPHMRRDEICERSRAWTWMRVEVDGKEVMMKAFKPIGLSGDGVAAGLEYFDLRPGEHRIAVMIRDTEIGEQWHEKFERTVNVPRDRRILVSYEAKGGFQLRPEQ